MVGLLAAAKGRGRQAKDRRDAGPSGQRPADTERTGCVTDDDIPWVAVRDHLDPVEADVIASLLRANNIPVMERREAINVAYAFRVGPLAGVRLYVPLHRAAEAEVLLKALASERHDEPLERRDEPVPPSGEAGEEPAPSNG